MDQQNNFDQCIEESANKCLSSSFFSSLASDQKVLMLDKIKEHFGSQFIYANQQELLGTAHAAYTGINVLPESIKHVIVLGGDDGSFYKPETLRDFIAQHKSEKAVVSLLTAEVENPSHFGRIIRTTDGGIRIMEKEYLTPEQANINEVSTGTFCFDRQWFEELFPTIMPLKKLGEYVLPTMFALAQGQGARMHCVKLTDASEWFGVNTIEELNEADRRKQVLL